MRNDAAVDPALKQRVYAGTQVQRRPAEAEAAAAPARQRQVAGTASRENVSGISSRCWRLSEWSCTPVSSPPTTGLDKSWSEPALLPTGGCTDLLKLIPCKEKAVNQQLF